MNQNIRNWELMYYLGFTIVVLGSYRQWLGCNAEIRLVDNFLWGHQVNEYIELGRIWQILLLVGLVLWLILMLRALMPALKKKDENRHICLHSLVLASVAIAMFYGMGLM